MLRTNTVIPTVLVAEVMTMQCQGDFDADWDGDMSADRSNGDGHFEAQSRRTIDPLVLEYHNQYWKPFRDPKLAP